MASASEPRQAPFTNDVAIDYDTPEKPPIGGEDSVSPVTDAGPVSPINSDPIHVNTLQPPHAFPLPHYDSPTHSLRTATTYPLPEYLPPANPAPKLERFVIPTKNDSLSSGFPYDPRVYDLITHDEWHLLSSDIVNAAKLTFGEDIAAWTTGVTTGTLSSPFIIFFAPWVGWVAGHAVHRKAVVKTVKERLDRDGELRSVLRRWNEQRFLARGFQAWLELPVDGGEIKTGSNAAETKTKKEKRAEKKTSKRFRIVIIPNSGKVRENPTFAAPWLMNHDGQSTVSLVEAPGMEHRSPVELSPTRDPAELQV